MRKKDYELIANAIKYERDFQADKGIAGEDIVRGVDASAYQIASYLEQENPKFDRQMFLTACGIEAREQLIPRMSVEYAEKLGRPLQ